MIILFFSFFALFGIVFLIVWMDAGNTYSNAQAPVVVETLITILNLHFEFPFSVHRPQIFFKWKLCKTVGCYSNLAVANMGPVNVNSQPSFRGRGLVNSNFGQVVLSTNDRQTVE